MYICVVLSKVLNFRNIHYGSLLLIALALGLYIKKVYDSEKNNLNREAAYLFINSIDKLEGGAMKNFIIRKSENKKILKINDSDSIKIISMINSDTSNVDTISRMLKKLTVKGHDNSVEGIISLMLHVNADSAGVGLDLHWNEEMQVLKNLDSSFKNKLQATGIPLNYKIVKRISKDANAIDVTASYTDISSGQQFDLSLTDNFWWTLQKIWLEILFACLVFLLLVLAFQIIKSSIDAETKMTTLRQELMQNITHELKTPIATSQVAIEALQQFSKIDDKETRNDYLNIAKQELGRLENLVERVLNFQKMENETTLLYKENINLNELFESLREDFNALLVTGKVSINLSCDDKNLTIFTDRQLLRNLLYNIIDNGIKYNENQIAKIDIQVLQHSYGITICIEDNGIGIPKEYLQDIFKKFYRVPKGMVHNVKGHGLGLAFVDYALRTIEGKVEVSSIPGKGTKFEIKLSN